MKNRCIVNFAIDEPYETKQKELIGSLCPSFAAGAEIRAFYNYDQIGVKPEGRDQLSRFFKPYAMLTCILEFDYLLWIDANVIVVSTLEPVFEMIEKEGYFFLDSGHNIGEWSSDKSLDYFGVSRDEALKLPELHSCVIGLNMQNEKAIDFLHGWKMAADMGIFNGSRTNDNFEVSNDNHVKGHRHDQTCASLIAHQLGLTNFKRGFTSYLALENEQNPRKPSVIFVKT